MLAASLLAFVPVATAAGDGASLFLQHCGTCHTITPDAGPRAGPPLGGVIGRRVASVPGFAYSDALSRQDFVWDEARLDDWLADAGRMVPGTTMFYRQSDPAVRQAIIAYLKTAR